MLNLRFPRISKLPTQKIWRSTSIIIIIMTMIVIIIIFIIMIIIIIIMINILFLRTLVFKFYEGLCYNATNVDVIMLRTWVLQCYERCKRRGMCGRNFRMARCFPIFFSGTSGYPRNFQMSRFPRVP